MKSLLLSVSVLSVLFLSSCSLEEPTPAKENTTLKQLIQKLQAEQVGTIQKLELNNIEVERTTTGARQKFASYANTYSPALELFDLSFVEGDITDVYTMGIKQGADILDLQLKYFETYDFDTEFEDEWIEINGIRYDVNYEFTEGFIPPGQTVKVDKAVMTLKPTKPVPGTSNDYTNLINAFNLGNGPKFNLSNLRVVGLDNIVLTIYF